MKKWLLPIMAVIIVGAASISAAVFMRKEPPKQLVQTQQVAVSKPTRSQLLILVNQERAKNGVAPLTEDARLDQSAQMKADDEVQYNYFGHVSPPGSAFAGQHGYQYIGLTSLRCTVADENIAENTFVNTASTAVNAWIESPPHHAAMIDARYTLTGFGINRGQIVEHFCQPV